MNEPAKKLTFDEWWSLLPPDKPNRPKKVARAAWEYIERTLQSLSQEAVREEALEAERILKIISELEVTEQGAYTNAGKVMRQMARNYFALKREPNAAGQGASDD